MGYPVHMSQAEEHPVNKPERYHALDGLRAVMMLLGVVLHAAVTYMVTPIGPWPLKDSTTSLFFDLLVYTIHIFRIPVFFVMSGFFGAMLLQKRGVWAMMVHRVRRIILPFLIFWPPLFLVTAPLTIAGWQRCQSGVWGPLDFSYFTSRPAAPWFNTLHLWFLYYLAIFYLLTPALVYLINRIPAAIPPRVLSFFACTVRYRVGALALAIPAIISGFQYPHGMVEITGSFIPDLPQLMYHGSFFLAGFLLWYRRELLGVIQARYRGTTILAGLSAVIPILVEEWLRLHPLADPFFPSLVRCISVNLATWWGIFAITGLFLTYFNYPSPRLRWLTDSAYWVYLVHLPVTIAISLPMFDLAIPPSFKFITNLILTSLICLASYDLWIRNGRIGELLNGRRHARGLPVAEPEACPAASADGYCPD